MRDIIDLILVVCAFTIAVAAPIAALAVIFRYIILFQ